MKMYSNKGKPSTKEPNEWGKAFAATLLEKGLTIDDALKLFTLQPYFAKLNRSTLYRWGAISDVKVPPRAYAALEMLKQRPTINASNETISQWMEKLTRIAEEFDTMRTEIRIVIAQLSFHKN